MQDRHGAFPRDDAVHRPEGARMNVPVDQGAPAADPDGFRRALGEFATGVNVVCTRVGGTDYGLTSNSFSSVSLDPPLVLWSIRRASQSFPAFAACTHFAVNVLAADQTTLSQRFAKSGHDKFAGVDWRPGIGDAPVIADVAASFECRLADTFDGGDHVILVGHVERYRRFDRQPLLFAKGRYAVAADHPDTRVLGPAEAAQAPSGSEEDLLSLLMVRAYSAIATRLEGARRSAGLGLSLMQARLLKAAHTHSGRTLEELLPELFLDFNASRHVLESVVDLGLLEVGPDGRLVLTKAGEARILAIVEHTRANEAMLFGSISAADLETTQRVLRRIVEEQGPARPR
jgi:flavin reductase (DIM6/NTAB) family NADH-FMN oxidoreductase RutF/DNA-binding MarR family transcriptional regulator